MRAGAGQMAALDDQIFFADPDGVQIELNVYLDR